MSGNDKRTEALTGQPAASTPTTNGSPKKNIDDALTSTSLLSSTGTASSARTSSRRKRREKRERSIRTLQEEIRQQLQAEADSMGARLDGDGRFSQPYRRSSDIQRQAEAMVHAAIVAEDEARQKVLPAMTASQIASYCEQRARELVESQQTTEGNSNALDLESRVQLQAQALDRAITQAQINAGVYLGESRRPDDAELNSASSLLFPDPSTLPRSPLRQSPAPGLLSSKHYHDDPLLQQASSPIAYEASPLVTNRKLEFAAGDGRGGYKGSTTKQRQGPSCTRLVICLSTVTAVLCIAWMTTRSSVTDPSKSMHRKNYFLRNDWARSNAPKENYETNMMAPTSVPKMSEAPGNDSDQEKKKSTTPNDFETKQETKTNVHPYSEGMEGRVGTREPSSSSNKAYKPSSLSSPQSSTTLLDALSFNSKERSISLPDSDVATKNEDKSKQYATNSHVKSTMRDGSTIGATLRPEVPIKGTDFSKVTTYDNPKKSAGATQQSRSEHELLITELESDLEPTVTGISSKLLASSDDESEHTDDSFSPKETLQRPATRTPMLSPPLKPTKINLSAESAESHEVGSNPKQSKPKLPSTEASSVWPTLVATTSATAQPILKRDQSSIIPTFSKTNPSQSRQDELTKPSAGDLEISEAPNIIEPTSMPSQSTNPIFKPSGTPNGHETRDHVEDSPSTVLSDALLHHNGTDVPSGVTIKDTWTQVITQHPNALVRNVSPTTVSPSVADNANTKNPMVGTSHGPLSSFTNVSKASQTAKHSASVTPSHSLSQFHSQSPTRTLSHTPTTRPTTRTPTIFPSAAPTWSPTESPTKPTSAPTSPPTLPHIASAPLLPIEADWFFASLLLDSQAFYFPNEIDIGIPANFAVDVNLKSSDTKNAGSIRRLSTTFHPIKIFYHVVPRSKPPNVDIDWSIDWKKHPSEANAVGEYYLTKGKALFDITGSDKEAKSVHKVATSTISIDESNWAFDWIKDPERAVALGEKYTAIGELVEDHYRKTSYPLKSRQLEKAKKEKSGKESLKHPIGERRTWQIDWERGLKIATLFQDIGSIIQDHYFSLMFEQESSFFSTDQQELLASLYAVQGEIVANSYQRKSLLIRRFYSGSLGYDWKHLQIDVVATGKSIEDYYRKMHP